MLKKLDVIPGWKTIIAIVLFVVATVLHNEGVWITDDLWTWLQPLLLGLVGVGASVKIDRLRKK